ncbi:hypothetical protein AHiyo8_pI68030 (plasmid) [Arthrobacter sp. Hiyo8]|nr:hypothetical protein AHiyo8_pI68030 [Arthrobacter sp. Hiyo8]
MRFAAVQASPMLRIFAAMAPSTARSRSASRRTMKGALPPSSMEERRMFSAACRRRIFPTSVDPVKLIFRAIPLFIQTSTTDEELEVGTTLSTPSGNPASLRIAARAREVSGVSAAGLKTIVQPAAMAVPILRVPMARGSSRA